MTYTRSTKSEVLNFEPNKPTIIKLGIDPSKAKSNAYEKKSKPGEFYNKYTYFTEDGKVFWVMDKTHKALLNFAKGSEVEITNVVAEGQTYGNLYVKAPSGSGYATPSNVRPPTVAQSSNLENRLIVIEGLLKTIIQRLDSEKQEETINTPVNEKGEEEKVDIGIDF